MYEHNGHRAQSLLESERKASLAPPSKEILPPSRIRKHLYLYAPRSHLSLTTSPALSGLRHFSWQFPVSYCSNIHRQEQPPIAQRAFMSGPVVQHCDLKTHPAQILGQVLASVGVAVQADDQLIAVNAIGTCKLEEGGEAVKEQFVSRGSQCCLLRKVLTQVSGPVPSPHDRRRRKERARHPAPPRSF